MDKGDNELYDIKPEILDNEDLKIYEETIKINEDFIYRFERSKPVFYMVKVTSNDSFTYFDFSCSNQYWESNANYYKHRFFD